jgi:glycosyltransferase involved in cell wall biosynthesis
VLASLKRLVDGGPDRPSDADVVAVVVTRIAIPRPKGGSWTTMFEALFRRGDHAIDYLICPRVPPDRQLPSVEYVGASDTSVPILRRYLPSSRFAHFFLRLKQLAAKHERLVLLVVDDYNFQFAIDAWLRRAGLRDRTSIIFFIHGMSYFFDTTRAIAFYRSIDEIVYLTHASYALERSRTMEMPCEVSVVWNGVDKTKFAPLERSAKQAFRESLGLRRDTVCFLWLSRDQPKKGLHIVLRAWKAFVQQHSDVDLVVIGVPPRETVERVTFLGVVPHERLEPYVRMADIYLFPTLWSEGFGLSVVEALSARLLTIVSDIGPMREVLGGGRYGCLVSEPHVVEHWLSAMEQEWARFVANGYCNPYEALEPERYSIDGWCRDINDIVVKWKARVRPAVLGCAAVDDVD